MGSTLRRGTLPALVVFGICLLAAVAGYFTAGERQAGPATSTAPAITTPSSDTTTVSGRVVSFAGPNLVIDDGSGPRTHPLDDSSSVRFEELRPLDASSIKVGDWLNAGATDNRDTVFTLAGLVVIPAERVQSP